MGDVLNSIDNMLKSAADNGVFRRFWYDRIGTTTTAATTASGFVSAGRFTNTITIPSLGAGLTGIVFPNIVLTGTVTSPYQLLCGLEYELGTITTNGTNGTFSSGVSMPTKTIRGSSLQTATDRCFAVVTTALGTTNRTLTITYTNQDGVGSRTATLTIPASSAIWSAFDVIPHLQAGDTGIRSIQNITLTGTTGVIKIYGLLVLAISVGATFQKSPVYPLAAPRPIYLCETGEQIAFYKMGNTALSTLIALLVGVADN